MHKVDVSKISENIIEFTECVGEEEGKLQPYVDAYLLLGKEKALLVDSLQNTENLYEKVREYTNLPVTVILTHGHLDHAGVSLPKFHEMGSDIYLMEEDKAYLTDFLKPYANTIFKPLSDGQVFDIGNFKFETIACPGHTKGSVVFLDRKEELLFSGDSVGSGIFWMQIPGCLKISEYRASIERVLEEVSGLKALKIYPGHRNQSHQQLTGEYIKDNARIVEGILNGTVTGEEKSLLFHGNLPITYRSAAYGQMLDFCYDPKRVF